MALIYTYRDLLRFSITTDNYEDTARYERFKRNSENMQLKTKHRIEKDTTVHEAVNMLLQLVNEFSNDDIVSTHGDLFGYRQDWTIKKVKDELKDYLNYKDYNVYKSSAQLEYEHDIWLSQF